MEKDGGPAFPSHRNGPYGTEASVGGMTLRQWYAGQALAGILVDGRGLFNENVERAFEYADAMIAMEAPKP